MPTQSIPQELCGLWNLQYKPLEKHIFKILTTGGIDKPTAQLIKDYKKLSFIKKITVLDKFAAQMGL